MTARMKTDIILASIAGMAETLAPHFPELALEEVHKAATDALSKWPVSVLRGKKAVKYIKTVERKLDAFDAENVFKGATMAGVINFWLAILETLHGETSRKRSVIIDDLQDLLREYTEHLKLDKDEYIEEGSVMADKFFEVIERA